MYSIISWNVALIIGLLIVFIILSFNLHFKGINKESVLKSIGKTI
jgi:hypothetical protein